MNAKKIATSLPASQYEDLERLRLRLHMKRSEAVQQALALWIAAREEDEKVAQYLRGYAELPERPGDEPATAEAWAQGQQVEDW